MLRSLNTMVEETITGLVKRTNPLIRFDPIRGLSVGFVIA